VHRKVTTTDNTLEIFSARNLNSKLSMEVPAGMELDLDEITIFEGRQWIEVTARDGAAGFVLAPAARGHTSLGDEDKALRDIVRVESVTKNAVGPSGVGGWLIILILGLLSTPLITLGFVPLYRNIWTASGFAVLAVAASALSGLSVFVVLALLNRWQYAPKLAQAQLVISWFASTGLIVATAISGVINLGSGGFGQVVGSVFGTALWILYLRYSDRVAATYGPMAPGRIRVGQAAAIALTAGVVLCLTLIGPFAARAGSMGLRSQ
jgi:hypothetical protein